ncbi:hypothetical protein WT41_26695 [Burkholderia territorii]|nr:hypothetical protein WT41_26695 [Burkholderia territorii]
MRARRGSNAHAVARPAHVCRAPWSKPARKHRATGIARIRGAAFGAMPSGRAAPIHTHAAFAPRARVEPVREKIQTRVPFAFGARCPNVAPIDIRSTSDRRPIDGRAVCRRARGARGGTVRARLQ